MENKTVYEMDIIELAREIGRKLQQDESYIRYQMARQAADEDQSLQQAINEFSEKRDAINEETSKDEGEKDTEKLQQLGKEMRVAYAKIMSNENMINYDEAKNQFDVLLRRVNTIIQLSSEGEDPDTADYTPSCSGSCASCGGCN